MTARLRRTSRMSLSSITDTSSVTRASFGRHGRRSAAVSHTSNSSAGDEPHSLAGSDMDVSSPECPRTTITSYSSLARTQGEVILNSATTAISRSTTRMSDTGLSRSNVSHVCDLWETAVVHMFLVRFAQHFVPFRLPSASSNAILSKNHSNNYRPMLAESMSSFVRSLPHLNPTDLERELASLSNSSELLESILVAFCVNLSTNDVRTHTSILSEWPRFIHRIIIRHIANGDPHFDISPIILPVNPKPPTFGDGVYSNSGSDDDDQSIDSVDPLVSSETLQQRNSTARANFFSLSPITKAKIMYALVDWQLSECASIRDTIESTSNERRRAMDKQIKHESKLEAKNPGAKRKPVSSETLNSSEATLLNITHIGLDKTKRRIYQFGDHPRIYSLDLRTNKWDPICSTLNDLTHYTECLSDTGSEKHLRAYLIDTLIPHLAALEKKRERSRIRKMKLQQFQKRPVLSREMRRTRGTVVYLEAESLEDSSGSDGGRNDTRSTYNNPKGLMGQDDQSADSFATSSLTDSQENESFETSILHQQKPMAKRIRNQFDTANSLNHQNMKSKTVFTDSIYYARDIPSDRILRKHGKTYPFRHRLVCATSQLASFHKAIPVVFATVWIDTAGTLPAGSQPTVSASARLSCLVPIDSCSTVPSNQRWSRSASPFKTPPRSQVYTFSTPGSSAATQQSES
ncbi:hypothetical protein BASA83_006518 [Batrachochytrium salamandrivorans]|nr:hypothetical protein BASA83_006518 [Batrachochytrium salamandrivorans]